MKVTQGILKWCNIYGITFDNKYSDIKTILTTEDYSSKFLSNNIGKVSQTSTISSNDNIFNELKESVYKIKIEYGLFPIINIYIDEDKSLFREFRMNYILAKD